MCGAFGFDHTGADANRVTVILIGFDDDRRIDGVKGFDGDIDTGESQGFAGHNLCAGAVGRREEGGGEVASADILRERKADGCLNGFFREGRHAGTMAQRTDRMK